MKLRKAATLLILGILHIVILLPKSLCSGVFELRLSQFKNERGLDYDGNCCNGVKNPTNSPSGSVCTEQCHTFFTICLTNFMNDIPANISKEKCLFGHVTTNVLGYNSVDFENLDGFNNVIMFHFNISWPGTFSIIIEAWHDATLSNPVTGSPRERIFRMAASRQQEVGPDWNSFIKQGVQSTELEYKYRVTCDKDYYGPGCSQLCRPRDDHFGHYTCAADGSIVCMPGWKGNYCDQAICLEGCEEEHGFCNKPNECKCRLGWEGPLCKNCTKYPGCMNGSCTRPYECNCFEGWGGLFCNQDLNYCTHHTPCQNGGVCQNSGSGSYTCTCPEGFNGTNCERQIDNCQNLPCLNGGHCINEGSDFICQCPESFTGKRCNIVAESCKHNPCKNGATCLEGNSSTYKCICDVGFSGRNCDERVYSCDSSPCHNNGRCIDEVNGFKCVCESGFSGDLCDRNDDDCAHNPCFNEAVCIDLVNDFECRCVPGFIGELCETNVDDCELRPCANGGSCKDLINDFECTCRPGFTGKFCNDIVDLCLSNPCRNGGTCEAVTNDYRCRCPTGFNGKSCEYIPGQKITTPEPNHPSTDSPVITTSSNGGNVNHNMTGTEQHGQSSDDEPFTKTQLLLLVCLGVGIPLLIIIIVVTFFLCRKRRVPDTRKEEEENVQNSINNKLRESNNIFTTLPQSSSTISNLTSKISNEESDYNTMKSFRSRPNSQIYVGDKQINTKQFIDYKNQDLQVHLHTKHRDFEKTTKSYEKEKLSIDPSNLDVRDYHSAQDIHYIDKHINRDTVNNRNSLLVLESPLHHETHRHSSSYYGDDVLATEV